MKRALAVICSICLFAVGLVFGFGIPGADIEAHTNGLYVNPTSQVLGGPVDVYVNFLDDENDGDPQITLDGGLVWASTGMPSCVALAGATATIHDESCDSQTSISTWQVRLTTICSAVGTFHATSSLHTGTMPNTVSFTCVRVKNSETQRANLQGPGGHGSAVLTHVGDTLVLTVDARRLLPLTQYSIRLGNFGPTCAFGGGWAASDARGDYSATATFSETSFMTFCGTAATVQVVLTSTGEVVLKGDLNK